MDNEFEFEVTGIGDLIKRYRLTVPSNQREYSWLKEVQVKELLQDITTAIRNPDKPYFLGTVVLTKTKNDIYEIADGQQRLATTTMIIAAIRDWFRKRGTTVVVQALENDYLCTIDIDQQEKISKLTLNVDDNEFFNNKVVRAAHNKSEQQAVRRSHKLIIQAFEEINNHISNLEKSNGENTSQVLKDWIRFLANKATVVKLSVLNTENAFKMFETLNDRGLKTSQADLVKNYLFNISENRLSEAQKLWSSMKAAIETVSDDDEDITMDFLKTACAIKAGVTSKKDIMKVVQDGANNRTECITLMTLLEEFSKEYAAIINPEHQKWNEYEPDVRKSIQAINLFGAIQISPLMLAIAKYFGKNDVAISLKRLVSWSVRFKIGGYTGGRLDAIYTRLAKKIYDGDIKNEKQLKTEAEKDIIRDSEFKSSFETAKVNNARLARYYLRSLETTARGEDKPEFIPNDSIVINLEHIMPGSPNEHWNDIKKQDFDFYYNRIGNMALMQADKNSNVGNLPFQSKKEEYKKSAFSLTSILSDSENFGVQEIEDRQKIMAEIALKTWKL